MEFNALCSETHFKQYATLLSHNLIIVIVVIEVVIVVIFHSFYIDILYYIILIKTCRSSCTIVGTV